MKTLKTVLIFSTLAMLIGCNQNPADNKSAPPPDAEVASGTFAGSFVSDGYDKRAEGYDWVGVTVTQTGDSLYDIAVRSRADKKKPTCTFDATARQVGGNLLRAEVSGQAVLFTFTDGAVTIGTEKPEDENVLYYYCSGGGSLGGKYLKIDGPLDESQVDPRTFVSFLNYSDYYFYINATGKGSMQQLEVEPAGFTIDNSIVRLEVEGEIIGAEVGDLNIDGYPELLIYTRSAGSGSYGQVICFSSNNGKSMSMAFFPDIQDNPEASKGYMGHDAFALVENTLVRRFPIYNPGDANATPTGGTRQIQYKLADGENSRILVVDKIIEY